MDLLRGLAARGLTTATARCRGLRIAIMTDETGWHTRQLQAALRARGCGRALRRSGRLPHRHRPTPGTACVIPGFGRELPDAALVRGIAGGSFEQVTKRLGVLHALRELGVPVYNDARAIERSVDKSMTSLLLHAAGVPTPPTWATESAAEARRIVDARRRGRACAGAQAAVRLAGQGPAAASARSTARTVPLPALGDDYGGAGLPAALRAGRDRRPASTGACSSSAGAPSRRCGGSARTGSTTWRRARAASRPTLTPALGDAGRARRARRSGMDYAGVDLMPERRRDRRCSRSTASPRGGACSA